MTISGSYQKIILNQIRDVNLSDIVLKITSIYVLSTTYSISSFLRSGNKDYMRFDDYIFIPLMAIFAFFIINRSILFIFKDQKIKLTGIINKQLLLLFIYLLFYVSNMSIYDILLYHIIIATALLANDILKNYFNDVIYIRNVLFYFLLTLSVVFLSLHDNTWANNKYNIFTNFKKPLDTRDKVRTPVHDEYDKYCENATYNAAKYYNENGFFSHYLLPVMDYQGAPAHILPDVKNNFVYTHISGIWPSITLGVLYKLMGKDADLTYNKYRFYPFIWYIIGFIALLTFFKEISDNYFIGLMLALLVVLQPAVNLIKLSLYCHSYAFSFLFIELFATIKYYKRKEIKYLAILFMCGFIQGGISVDFYVHVLLAPLLIIILLNEEKVFKINNFYPFLSILSGLIFTLLIMLTINSFYFGSLSHAIKDFIGTAKYRSTLIWENIDASQYYIYNLIKEYSTIAENPKFFNFPILEFYTLITLVFGIMSFGNVTIANKKIDFSIIYIRKITLFLIASFITSLLWLIIMKNHSTIHVLYITRYFILLFIAMMSALAILINKKNWKLVALHA